MNSASSEKSRSSEVLKSFFAIPLAVIDEDLRNLSRDAPLLRSAEKKFRRENPACFSPEEVARSLHRRFLLGVVMKEISELPSDLVLFAITLPAYEIAELASTVSSGAGSLLEIGEFLAACEESGRYEGYRSAERRSDELLADIHDTVFLDALFRYGQTGAIALYENNRPLFDLRQEVGRFLLSPDLVGPDERAFIEKDFLLRYGPEFVQEFARRLDRHGLAFS